MITVTYKSKEYSANSWGELKARFPELWNSPTGALRIRDQCIPIDQGTTIKGEVLRITWSKPRPKYPSQCRLEIVHIQNWNHSPQFALVLDGKKVAKKTLYMERNTNSA